MRAVFLAFFSLVLLALAGCAGKGGHRVPPVEQLNQPPDNRLAVHVVSRGDTLYSIAWRYGIDFHQLAQINGIQPPAYRIMAGQKLSLRAGGATGAGATMNTASGTRVVAIPEDGGVSVVSEVRREKPVKPLVKPGVKRSDVPAVGFSRDWIWPASGKVISRFNSADPLSKGIDIDGKLGEPVLAAGSGSVVYAGSGLAGYGQLVIVKHNEQFLSAYAHNNKLMVKEGDSVKAGQKIAEIGSSGTDTNKLHFEIRHDGKPVDPLQYLPKR